MKIAIFRQVTRLATVLGFSLGLAAFANADEGKVSAEAVALLPKAVKEAGVLRIAMPDQGKPFAYKQDGKLMGMDVGLANALAGALGLEPKITLVPFASSLTGLQAQKFDISFGEFFITADRLKVADMVTSWQGYHTFLVRNAPEFKPMEIKDLCGYKTAAMAGSIELAMLMEQKNHCPNAPLNISAFPSTTDAALALSSSRVDAVFLDRGAAESLLAVNKSLIVSGRVGGGVMAIAVARNEKVHGLAFAVKSAIEHLIASGQYIKILAENNTDFGAITESVVYEAKSKPPAY